MRDTFLILFLFILLAVAHKSYGCEVTADYKRPSLKQRTNAATFVFEGSADMSAETRSPKYGRSARVNVVTWLKGQGPSDITVHRFGWGPDCLSPIPRERSVFFANRVASDNYVLNYLGVLDAVETATSSTVGEILKIVSGDSSSGEDSIETHMK
jgi:hypothetical protein